MIKPRKNETTAISNRTLLDDIPPSDVGLIEWAEFRAKYNKASNLEFKEYPLQVNIELQGDCNYKCPFCIQSYKDRSEGTLDFNTFRKIIKEAVAMGTRSLKLSNWNEPLLTRDLERYIRYAKMAGILNVYISTNGSLLTKKRARSLIDSGLTKIFISIDATNPRTYKEQRLVDNYRKVVKNIEGFLEVRGNNTFPALRVNFLKTTVNEGQEEEFLEQWKGKADFVGIQVMNELPDKESGVQREEDNRENYRCSFPFKLLTIDHSGQILPCCVMYGSKMPLGNISDMTLSEAWNSKQMKALQDLHREGRFQDNELCKRCINSKI
jgi:radical SAM protein with 4Fe4S-binding SPASM domain